MEILLWFGFCLLACVGGVRIVGWVVCEYHRPKNQLPGYYIVPLSADSDALEAQLRHCLRCRNWNGIPGAIIVLPERELDEDGIKICQRMLRNLSGVFLCYPWELEKTLEGFNRISSDPEEL